MSDTPDIIFDLSIRLIDALDRQTKAAEDAKALRQRLLELAPDRLWIVALSPTLARVIDTHDAEVCVGTAADLLFPAPAATGPVEPPRRGRKAAEPTPSQNVPTEAKLAAEAAHAAAAAAISAVPADQTPARLAAEEVISRLRVAIAGAKTSASEYAQVHNLPYLALTRLLASGTCGEDAAYRTLSDHAARLPSSAAPAPGVEIKPAAGPAAMPGEDLNDALMRDLCRQAAAKVGPVRVREIMGASKVEGVPAEKRAGVAHALRDIIAGKA